MQKFNSIETSGRILEVHATAACVITSIDRGASKLRSSPVSGLEKRSTSLVKTVPYFFQGQLFFQGYTHLIIPRNSVKPASSS